MKLRIVKKQIRGYRPTYHLEQRYLGFIWLTLTWSIELKPIEECRDRYIKDYITDKDLGVIWEN